MEKKDLVEEKKDLLERIESMKEFEDDPDWLRIKYELQRKADGLQRKADETPPSDPTQAQIWHLDRNLGVVWRRDIGLLQRTTGRLQWLAWLLVILAALILWRVW